MSRDRKVPWPKGLRPQQPGWISQTEKSCSTQLLQVSTSFIMPMYHISSWTTHKNLLTFRYSRKSFKTGGISNFTSGENSSSWLMCFISSLVDDIAARFLHLCACLTCSSVHASSLHPLLAHHHLCYVGVYCVVFFVFLFFLIFAIYYISLWLHFGLFMYIFSIVRHSIVFIFAAFWFCTFCTSTSCCCLFVKCALI